MKVKTLMICLFVFCFLLNGTILWAAEEKEGKVVALNSHPRTILLKEDDEIEEYRLSRGVEIKINGEKGDFSSLEPENNKYFFQVRIAVNQAGKVEEIKAFYKQRKIKIKGVNSKQIVVKDLNTYRLHTYNLTENISLVRNNNPIAIKDLKTGAIGKAVLGQEGELLKIDINHYQLTLEDSFWNQLVSDRKSTTPS